MSVVIIIFLIELPHLLHYRANSQWINERVSQLSSLFKE